MACPGCSRPLCNWMGSGLVFKINAGRIVVKWGEKSQRSMVPRCSQSVPTRLNQRACSWNMADWETEVGLSRALWLWREFAAWRKRRTAKRRLEPQERKLSASLFIKKEVGLRIIWIGFGWMEFLQKLQGEQLAALSRRWIMWSGVTERSSSALKQFAASTLLKNEDGLLDLTIPPGWKGFLRRLQACQRAVFKRRWDIWSGVTARLIRIRRQVASRRWGLFYLGLLDIM